jgi:peptidoglycan/LPS O-acetylase OafA/YrhL
LAPQEPHLPDDCERPGHRVVLLLATIALAALPWHLFERPINQLKRLFPYRANGPNPRVEVHLCAAKRE